MKSNVKEARELIANLDLSKYSKKMSELYPNIDINIAENEYRQHLLLCYINKKIEGDGTIVPTKNADPLWHQHLLFSQEYSQFCNELYGEFLHHYPGLEEGTKPFEDATAYTRQIHASSSKKDNFVPVIYGSHAEPKEATTQESNVTTESTPSVTDSTTSSFSSPSSCGGASCGGGGCGAG